MAMRSAMLQQWHLHTPAGALKSVVRSHQDVFGKVYVFHTTRAMVRDFDAELRALGYGKGVSSLPERLQPVDASRQC